MSNSIRTQSIVKPAKSQCQLIQAPISHCELLPAGLPGCLAINGTPYKIEILGYLPPAPAEPVVQGYRLDKGNGEVHDICLVAGRLECTCGDYEFRRAALMDPKVCDCKHTAAIRQLLPLPMDQYEPRVEPRYEDDLPGERCDICSGDASDPRGCECVRDSAESEEADLDEMEFGQYRYVRGQEVRRTKAGWLVGNPRFERVVKCETPRVAIAVALKISTQKKLAAAMAPVEFDDP